MEKKVRAQRKISVNVWADEYDVFKQKCHDERTTPSALINKFIREYGQKPFLEENNRVDKQ